MHCFTLCVIRKPHRWTSNKGTYVLWVRTYVLWVRTYVLWVRTVLQHRRSNHKHSLWERWRRSWSPYSEKFRSSSKNLDDQTSSGRPKNVDFEVVLQSKQIRRVVFREYQASLAFHSLEWFITLMSWTKATRIAEMCLTLRKILQNFQRTRVFYIFCLRNQL